MEGCRRKLKCLSIPEKVKVIEAVDRKDKIKQEIDKKFDIPVSTLSTIFKKDEVGISHCMKYEIISGY